MDQNVLDLDCYELQWLWYRSITVPSLILGRYSKRVTATVHRTLWPSPWCKRLATERVYHTRRIFIHGSTTLSLEFHGGCAAGSWLVLLVELVSSAYILSSVAVTLHIPMQPLPLCPATCDILLHALIEKNAVAGENAHLHAITTYLLLFDQNVFDKNICMQSHLCPCMNLYVMCALYFR